MSQSAPDGGSAGFSAILASGEVATREATYRRKDEEAVRERRGFVRLLGAINWLILLLAVLSGLVLAQGAFSGLVPGWELRLQTVVQALAAAIIAITILATVLGQFARDGDRLGRWRRLRADAEMARGQRFQAIARAAAVAGPGPAREALDLVVRDLLLSQRDWYLRRAAQHRGNARITGLWNAAALVLGGTATAAALSVAISPASGWLLLVGVLAAALSSFAADREALHRDRTNAELYELTAERLSALAGGADRVAAEIGAGNPAAVTAFADLVAEELAAEHRQWATGLDAMAELLARLDQRVAQAKAARAAGPAGVVQQVREGVAGLRDHAAEVRGGVEEVRERVGSALQGGVAGVVGAVADIATGRAPPPALADLGKWKDLLSATAAALPPPHGDRARALAEEAGQALASGAAGAAQAVLGKLAASNPAAQWLGEVAPRIGAVLGTAVPPLGLVIGLAGVGAKLGEAEYRRWTTRVLGLPFAPRQLGIEGPGGAALLAALEAAPAFGAALAAERGRGDMAALSEVGALLGAADGEVLWARLGPRFAGRAAFDAALREVRDALLGAASDADLAAALPGPEPRAMLDAAGRLRDAPEGREVLEHAVRLVHELRAAGHDPATAMQALMTDARGKP